MFFAKPKTSALPPINGINVEDLSPTLIRDQFDATCHLPFFNRGNSEETKKLLAILDLCHFKSNNPTNSTKELKKIIEYNYNLCRIAKKAIEKWHGWRENKSTRATQLKNLSDWLAKLQKKFEYHLAISHEINSLNTEDEIYNLQLKLVESREKLEKKYVDLKEEYKKECLEKKQKFASWIEKVDKLNGYSTQKIVLGNQEINPYESADFCSDTFIKELEKAEKKYLDPNASREILLFIKHKFDSILKLPAEDFVIKYKETEIEIEETLKNPENILKKLPENYQSSLDSEECSKKNLVLSVRYFFFQAALKVKSINFIFIDSLSNLKETLEHTAQKIKTLTHLEKICELFTCWSPAPATEFTSAPTISMRKNAFLLPIFNYALDLDCFDYLLDCYNFTADLVTSGLF